MQKIVNFDSFTEEIFKNIDITPTQYETAKAHYEAVAKVLTESGIAEHVYTQGSFSLGTVIRPFKGGKDADFDIDLVSLSAAEKLLTSPSNLKKETKVSLLQSPHHKDLLDPDEGRRCWTLNYAPTNGVGFHMDILPCVQESNDIIQRIINSMVLPAFANNSIAITDLDKSKKLYSWSTGNPMGLRDWFKTINVPYLQSIQDTQRRALVSKGFYATVEAVPEILLKSPLQRVIQLLKRHRDVHFDDHKDYDYRPISIIITVLVAQIADDKKLYTASTYDLLMAVVDDIAQYASLKEDSFERASYLLSQKNAVKITRDKDGWHFPNPVNPLENFADKWSEDGNARAKVFFEWVAHLKKDLAIHQRESADVFDTLQKSLGAAVVKNVYNALQLEATKTAPTVISSTNQPKPYRR